MKNIIEKIDEWAIKTPHNVCYQEEDKVWTFKDLKEKSDKIAAHLERHYDDRLPIIVYGGLDVEMVVTFIGAVKAGHAYIPIDSSTPVERVELITEVADYTAVVAIDEWPIEKEAKDIITLKDVEYIFEMDEKPTLSNKVDGDDTFYIIFTSGTTGVPKGVQISHNNLASYTEWMLQDFCLEEGKVFLSQAPYSFDLSVMDVYPALLSGGRLVPMKKEMISDFKTLFLRLPKMTINVWVSTPSFADICLMDPRFNEEENPSITHFLFCGEELVHRTAESLMARFPHAKIYNTYGPTEATVAITQIEMTKDILEKYARIPIGYVKEDTKVLIVDEEGHSLSEGKVGEIVIVGPSVSKGYFHNPEKTGEVFYSMAGQQAYKTGDAGLLEQGILHYKGRMDFQVKLHGYRIELEDIDHHLSESSYVKAAAVVPKYQENKVQQLVAYVVAKPHSFEKDYQLTKAIKEELKQSVMDYMVPQKFVYVDALPLTQNGKVDRKGLIKEVNHT